MRHRIAVFVFCLVGAAQFAAVDAHAESAAEKLHALFESEWQWRLRTDPEFATYLGDKRYNARWNDRSLEAIERRHRHRVRVLKRLNDIDMAALSPADRINYRLFQRKYRTAVEAHRFRWYLVPLNQRGGIQDANSTADTIRFTSVKDYEDWLSRLRAFPAYMEQTITLMKKGMQTGVLHAKVVMKRVPAQIRKQIVDNPEDSPFFKPFRSIPDSIDEATQKRLIDEAKQAISKRVVPSYRKMLTFFEREYLPACYDRVGVWQFPHGKEFYEFRARRYTTTDLTPRQIHEIGLREVKRIRGEMQGIMQEVKYKGTFQEFLKHLRTGSRFYYDDADELLKAYRATAKTVDPHLVKLFKTLPRIPYGVEPIPMQLAPDTTTAYYRPPAADGSRAGTYFVNLYKLDARPKYEIDALTLHEAVPGHHLQIALAMELENMPKFRRYSGYTAFVEGWGLYAESLGDRLGLYRDPYSRFGQLTYEMWRAVRLVVDTGMHYFRWSRKRAIDFFSENTAKTKLDIENEIDRYIAWPGQALAYKIGELKIKTLRAKAKRELGEQFDIREFHDVVLGSGAVTLDVLDENVTAWIRRRGASSNRR